MSAEAGRYTFSMLVGEALTEVLKTSADPKDVMVRLPGVLRDKLHDAGFAVHAVARCVRLPDTDPPGRPMTAEELAAVRLANGLPPTEAKRDAPG